MARTSLAGPTPPSPTARRAQARRRHPPSCARHDYRGAALRARRRDGRGPPGDRGQHDRPPQHREGLPGRPATPPSPSPARPGPPSRWFGSSRPSSSTTRRSRARRSSLEGKANQLGQMVSSNLPMAMQGLVVMPLFAGLRPALEEGAHLHLRRHRWPLRGDRLPRHRLGRTRRQDDHQARLPRGPRARRGDRARRRALCTKRPTRTPPPAAPTPSGASTPSSRPSTPRATPGSRTPRSRSTSQNVLERRRLTRGAGR